MMDYKEIEIDQPIAEGYNSEQRVAEIEPQNIPQGKEPQLNPNPGYGVNISQKFIDACVKAGFFDKYNNEDSLPDLVFCVGFAIDYGDETPNKYFEGTFKAGKYYEVDVEGDTPAHIYFACKEHNGSHDIYIYDLRANGFGFSLEEGVNGEKINFDKFTLIAEETDPELIQLFKNVGRHTESTIKTDLVEGEHVQPSNEFEKPEGAKVVKERTNFVGGLFANGVNVVDALNSIDAKQNKLYKHLVTFNVNGGGNCYGVFYSHIKNGTQAFTALSTGETIASSVQKGEGTQGTNPYFAVYTGIRKGSGNQAIVYGVKVTHYQEFRVSGSSVQIVTNRFESANTSATATAGSITTIEL